MKNKERVVVLGAGESGTGAALLAKAKGYEVFVSDKGTIAPKYKEELERANISFEEGKHTQELIMNATEVVKSPGIPEKVALVKALLDVGIPVIDELEFAFRFTEAKIIAITGTNGKTTTSLLTYHLLKSAGYSVGLAGNVGYSFARQVTEKHFDYYVLEVSSFQLDGMKDFKADIAVLLNISPDHLDRYDYSFEKYINSKMQLAQLQNEQGIFVYNTDDSGIEQAISTTFLTSKKYGVSLKHYSEAAYSEGEFLLVPAFDFRFDWKKAKIKGPHNKINALCAVTSVLHIGLTNEQVIDGLSSFMAVEHRLEFVANIRGVEFFNDSKATNVDAVKYALDSFTNPIVWIAGGVDKGNDYQVLLDLVKKGVKHLVILGKDKESLEKIFEGVVPLTYAKEMHEAVTQANRIAIDGEVILLSPACASFDLFKNYEERGIIFKEEVLSLKEDFKHE